MIGDVKRGDIGSTAAAYAAGHLEPKVFRFFQRHGVALNSGFGMTEATGGITMTVPGNYRDGSLGAPLPGIETKLAEADVRPGLTGDELAVVFHALVTGLLMNRALQPDGAQPEILAKVLRELLADADGPSGGEPRS